MISEPFGTPKIQTPDLKNKIFLSDMRVILSVSTSIKLMRMENGLNLLDYGRLRKAGNIVSYTHTGWTVNDAVL
jgi:hypothetical protein